jgi:hypothetical protein
MMRKMERGDALNEAEKSKAAKMPRPPRDFEREYRESCYYAPAPDAWPGINVNSLRKACIDACRLTTLKMTLAKMLFFVVPDGFDALTAWPIMRVHGTPEKFISSVRNAGRQRSVDLRARTLFRTWHLKPHIRYDASKITFEEIVQLVQRVGEQVGIGQGRPFSESSAGIGFGLFRVL